VSAAALRIADFRNRPSARPPRSLDTAIADLWALREELVLQADLLGRERDGIQRAWSICNRHRHSVIDQLAEVDGALAILMDVEKG
jgi:hypothetical protein